MMWPVPAKTFLLGEYAALMGMPAIVLTTTPCFSLSLTDEQGLQGIHPDSPAGVWWKRYSFKQGLLWHDPYSGKGGLGASSAQFVSVYLAGSHVLNLTIHHQSLLDAYYQSAWQGVGLKPSGYDLLAQTQHHCVYMNRQNNLIQSYEWGFKEIAFILIHSRQKLATHNHLQSIKLPNGLMHLERIVEQGKKAFEQSDASALTDAINDYHHQLHRLNLIAPHTQKHIQTLKQYPDVLAAKGCGALGADVILLVVPSHQLNHHVSQFRAKGWDVLATSNDLYTGAALIGL